MMLKRAPLSLLVMACGICGMIATAQAQQFIYKWTDAEGKLQYSELPPPNGIVYETVRKPSGPSSGVLPATPDPAKEQEKQAQEEAKKKEQAEAAQKQADDLRTKNCEVATKNLKALQGDSQVVKIDDKGNKVVLDDQQREAELQRAKKDHDYFCNP